MCGPDQVEATRDDRDDGPEGWRHSTTIIISNPETEATAWAAVMRENAWLRDQLRQAREEVEKAREEVVGTTTPDQLTAPEVRGPHVNRCVCCGHRWVEVEYNGNGERVVNPCGCRFNFATTGGTYRPSKKCDEHAAPVASGSANGGGNA